jgi:hypothetical protein
LFLGALGSAALITLVLLLPSVGGLITNLIQGSWRHLPEGTLFLCTAIVLTVLSWVAVRLQTGGIFRWIEHHPAWKLLAIGLVLFMGMSFAATLDDFEALLLKIGILQAELDQKSVPLGEAIAGLFAVAPAAVAGAIRYVSEKLSWEAELHGYEDALRTFRRARAELIGIEASPADPSVKQTRRNQLLIALGKEALEESEAWIRAHRERTIEPVV